VTSFHKVAFPDWKAFILFIALVQSEKGGTGSNKLCELDQELQFRFWKYWYSLLNRQVLNRQAHPTSVRPSRPALDVWRWSPGSSFRICLEALTLAGQFPECIVPY